VDSVSKNTNFLILSILWFLYILLNSSCTHYLVSSSSAPPATLRAPNSPAHKIPGRQLENSPLGRATQTGLLRRQCLKIRRRPAGLENRAVIDQFEGPGLRIVFQDILIIEQHGPPNNPAAVE